MEILKTYTITENQINAEKLHKEIVLSNSVDEFIGLQINGNELHVYGIGFNNESTLDDLIANHVSIDVLHDEIEKYNKRQYDGKVAIIQMMSELRLNSIVNNLPRSVNKEIESRYWDVVVAINNGWWITAKERAEIVIVADVVTQSFYDNVLEKINSYIALNY
jgi:hypothetical protein